MFAQQARDTKGDGTRIAKTKIRLFRNGGREQFGISEDKDGMDDTHERGVEERVLQDATDRV